MNLIFCLREESPKFEHKKLCQTNSAPTNGPSDILPTTMNDSIFDDMNFFDNHLMELQRKSTKF
jgi:hypothetical protein